MCSEKQKLSSLRETYGQLQRSYQHLEKDLGRRKEREAELLTLTEKLSSANAELQAARSSWETKVWGIQQPCVFSLCVLSPNRKPPCQRRSQYKDYLWHRHRRPGRRRRWSCLNFVKTATLKSHTSSSHWNRNQKQVLYHSVLHDGSVEQALCCVLQWNS